MKPENLLTPEQIERVLTRNSIKAGRRFRWEEMPVIITYEAKATDPFARAFDDADWWQNFDTDKVIASLKRMEGRGRSYARDADPRNRERLGKLVGLRFYFDNLRPDEPANLRVVLPLLRAIEGQE